jgi:hypothetical protein
MNKLRSEIMSLKIQLNSSYGMSGIKQGDMKGRSLYDEMLKKKQKFFKIQDRILKIKKIYG